MPKLHDHGGRTEELMSIMPSNERFNEACVVFSQLCDPTRLKIMWLLCHSTECVSNIASFVAMSSPAVSHHLYNLKSNGFIVSQRVGKEVYYRAADSDKVQLVHRMIDDLFEMNCLAEK